MSSGGEDFVKANGQLLRQLVDGIIGGRPVIIPVVCRTGDGAEALANELLSKLLEFQPNDYGCIEIRRFREEQWMRMQAHILTLTDQYLELYVNVIERLMEISLNASKV